MKYILYINNLLDLIPVAGCECPVYIIITQAVCFLSTMRVDNLKEFSSITI